MKQIVNLHIEKLPEGVYLATTNEIPGLVAQGRTVTKTLEIARDVAKKLLEAQTERQDHQQQSIEYPGHRSPHRGWNCGCIAGGRCRGG